MNYLSICFLVVLSEVARAQAVTDPTVDLRLNNLNNPSTGPLIFKVDARYEGQHGSPYFLPGWSNGQVSLRDGRQYKDVPLKFDAYRQALLLLRPKSGNDSIIIDRQTVNRFLLTTSNGQPYLFSRYPSAKVTDNDVKDGYFLILYEGKTALLKRIAKTFKPADYKGGYSADIRYDSYGDAFSYYLLKPDQTLTKIKLSKKAFLDALSDKESGLKAFIDQQKLSFKSEEDAITLVKQYDSL
ncbi:hypothetical protein [Spirosoma oryzicola]|uniref:hypothetical protein n=1 Tax=Spirosoma oryzicola TaxID=2898794 RepID=UPI001E4FF90D|nr:hypothetical protein [Spirosoma oryzicola]UHG92058.1 hypothetical protein LQ777_03925 [Spirosoma oryzicola]